VGINVLNCSLACSSAPALSSPPRSSAPNANVPTHRLALVQVNQTNFCANILLLVVLACQPPFVHPCSSAPALSSPPHSSAVDHWFYPCWSIDRSLRPCSSALDALTTLLRPCSSALDALTTFLWPLIASAVIPRLQRFKALLEQPSMWLASLASPATVTISVMALCHWQCVQGGDQ